MTHTSDTPGTAEANRTATTNGDTRSLIRRFLAAHARGDAEALTTFLSDDVTWQLPPIRRRRSLARAA